MPLEPLQIIAENFWDAVHRQCGDRGGIYRIHAYVNAAERRRYEIPRLFRVDPSGLLYIGMTEQFTRRLSALAQCINPQYTDADHPFGLRYNDLAEYEQRYHRESLFVELEPSEEPRAKEEAALESYLQQYGELPPFNRQR